MPREVDDVRTFGASCGRQDGMSLTPSLEAMLLGRARDSAESCRYRIDPSTARWDETDTHFSVEADAHRALPDGIDAETPDPLELSDRGLAALTADVLEQPRVAS